MSEVSMVVNGRKVSGSVEDRTLLVHFLRETLGLTGTHVGCDTSQCGACVVHVDGKAVKSCTMLAAQASGSEVVTIEGLADGADLHPVQAAFKKHHGLQCGFCTPGMIMAATAMIARHRGLDEKTVRDEQAISATAPATTTSSGHPPPRRRWARRRARRRKPDGDPAVRWRTGHRPVAFGPAARSRFANNWISGRVLMGMEHRRAGRAQGKQRFVTGLGRYVDDIGSGMKHAAFAQPTACRRQEDRRQGGDGVPGVIGV